MTKASRISLACVFALCTASAGAIAATAPPPIPAPQSVLPPPTITLAEARAIIDGAIAYARQHNAAMAVVVMDTAGDPIASERMDGVSLTYLQFAEGKAFASAMLRQTTEELSHLAKDRPDRYFGIMSMYPGKMYLVGGGEPLIVNGVMVGAVGVAALAQYEDEAAGRAGMAAWQRMRANRR